MLLFKEFILKIIIYRGMEKRDDISIRFLHLFCRPIIYINGVNKKVEKKVG